jgi:hypothetical protein
MIEEALKMITLLKSSLYLTDRILNNLKENYLLEQLKQCADGMFINFLHSRDQIMVRTFYILYYKCTYLFTFNSTNSFSLLSFFCLILMPLRSILRKSDYYFLIWLKIHLYVLVYMYYFLFAMLMHRPTLPPSSIRWALRCHTCSRLSVVEARLSALLTNPKLKTILEYGPTLHSLLKFRIIIALHFLSLYSNSNSLGTCPRARQIRRAVSDSAFDTATQTQAARRRRDVT